MKIFIMFFAIGIFIPIAKIYCKEKKLYTVNINLGGNASFSRNNNISKPHVFAYPNIFPTYGIGLSKKINNKSLFSLDYHYLSIGSNLKFDKDINQKGKNTLSSSALNHEISFKYFYLISKRYIDTYIGIGIDYYNSKNRGIGALWHLGDYKLGIYENGDYSISQNSIGFLPSLKITKRLNKILLSYNFTGRIGTKKILTTKYTFYENYLQKEQQINNYGDMIISTISIGYIL
jgi:hypothetical protein